MESTKAFKDTIKAYLDNRAENDSLFAISYAKEGKNINDCCTYILNQVKKSGCNGFADDEIFCMAVHYYDEDNLNVGKPISGRVVVNHVVAGDKPAKQSVSQKKPKRKVEPVEQLSLF